jgi:hypothetical protein
MSKEEDIYVGYVQYDPATGAIVQSGSIQEDLMKRCIERGFHYLVSDADGETHRVNLKTLSVEPIPPCPGQFDGMTLSGLPRPCKLVLAGPIQPEAEFIVDDGSAELDGLPDPGIWTVTVLADGYLTRIFELEVQ